MNPDRIIALAHVFAATAWMMLVSYHADALTLFILVPLAVVIGWACITIMVDASRETP